MVAEMILSEDGKLRVEGSVTIHNVVAATERGIAWFDRDDLVIDLAKVTEVDSSAVSMLLEWHREACRRNRRIHYVNTPPNLKGLAQLYGVSGLISLA